MARAIDNNSVWDKEVAPSSMMGATQQVIIENLEIIFSQFKALPSKRMYSILFAAAPVLTVIVLLGKRPWRGINETQYVDNVLPVALEFYIGGYQPAQKQLKDRKARELTFGDFLHYQKIIVALSETAKIMKEIDRIGIE